MNNKDYTKKEVLGKESKKVNELDDLTPINETMYDNLRETEKMNKDKDSKKSK